MPHLLIAGHALDFTGWLESLKSLGDVARILAGFGVVTVLLAYLKHTLERRCWRSFKADVRKWVDRLVESGMRHPKELSEDEWKAECERRLSDAGFSPLQVKQLLDVSVVAAKGIAAGKVLM